MEPSISQDTGMPPAEKTVTITDSRGNTILLPRTAERIVSQNGMATEVLIAIGAGDRVVGIGDSLATQAYLTDKIPQALSIGKELTPDHERIAALRPDVIIAYASNSYNIEKAASQNATVIYLACNSPLIVAGDARRLGKLTGNEEGAERYAQFVERHLLLAEERISAITEDDYPRVYLETYSDYMAQGNSSTGGSLLRMLRARNVAEEIPVSYATVSSEWIVDQDPDIIIKVVSRSDKLTEKYQSLIGRPSFSELRAAREGRVYVINRDYIEGPRGIAGLLEMARILHPEEFRDISPDVVLREYAAGFVDGSDSIATVVPPAL
jgi:iron complex transport system substrate-binding protein